MARYFHSEQQHERDGLRRSPPLGISVMDSHPGPSLSTIAPGYSRDYDVNRTSVSLVRPSHHHHQPPAAVIEEPVIEHEHHHLHHHIDHGDVTSRLAMTRPRPNLGREYSFDDLDIRERRYPGGGSVTTISTEHDHSSRSRTRRHRHRHRSRRGSEERTQISREYDDRDYVDREDDLTVIDVPAGTRRVYVNVEKSRSGGSDYIPSPSPSVDWRRERGVRRSRGLGNELWTEITKDLVTREAIEELGYQFEETEYFYYIFEYLDKEQIWELRELTDIIRHERVHDMQYESIASSSQLSLDRGLSRGPRSMRDERFEPRMLEDNDSRTEIIIESGHRDRQKRYRRYHY